MNIKVIFVGKYEWIKDMTDKELEERYTKEVNSEYSTESFVDALANEATSRGIRLDWQKIIGASIR